MTHTPSQDWITDHDELCRFAAVLLYVHRSSAQDILYFFEKPWKWEPEHQIWVDCGRPDSAEDEGWEAFLDQLVDVA